MPPASLPLLAAGLAARGHEVRVHDLNIRWHFHIRENGLPQGGAPSIQAGTIPTGREPDALAREYPALDAWLDRRVGDILASSPHLVGLSVFFSNRVAAAALARKLKARAPELFIVFGGPSCMTREECVEFLREGAPDAVVFGEGDLTLPALADDLAAGRAKPRPGLLLREDPSTWRAEPHPPENLDELPFAGYSLMPDCLLYKAKSINTARGCIRRCVYCGDWKEMAFRRMSARRIRDELAHQISLHPSRAKFHFSDSISNSSIPELSALCRALIGEGPNAEWSAWMIIRPDMGRGLIALMRAAGCRAVNIGVESASPRVLKAMNKRVPPELSARVLADLAGEGIVTGVNWIVGFPGESEEDFRLSLDFVRTNARSIGCLAPAMFMINELRGNAAEFGLPPDAHDMFWSSLDGTNTFPVRVRRLRRILEAAAECGVRAEYLGLNERTGFARIEEILLGRYREAQPA